MPGIHCLMQLLLLGVLSGGLGGCGGSTESDRAAQSRSDEKRSRDSGPLEASANAEGGGERSSDDVQDSGSDAGTRRSSAHSDGGWATDGGNVDNGASAKRIDLRSPECELPVVAELTHEEDSPLSFALFSISEDMTRCNLESGNATPEPPLEPAVAFMLDMDDGNRAAGSFNPWMLLPHPDGTESSNGHPDGEVVRILLGNGSQQLEVAFRFNGNRVSVGELWQWAQ